MAGFLNVQEFSNKLGVNRETGARLIKEKKLYPAFFSGKVYKIPDSVFHMKDIHDYEKEDLDGNIPCTTIMIGNNKGGTGKTTTSINVAASLAFFGYRVLIADLDTQANASLMNNLNQEHDFDKFNLTRILLDMKKYKDGELEDMLSKTIVNVESEHFNEGRLDLLPNSLEWDEEKELLINYPNAENMLTRVFKSLKSDYDFIILDTAPSMDTVWRMGVMASDFILVGTNAEAYSIKGLAGVFKRIYRLNEDYKDRNGRDIKVLGATIADYSERTNIAQINVPEVRNALHALCKYNEPTLLQPFISHSIKAAQQQTLSGPIMFDEPYSNMCYEYLELTKNIVYQCYVVRSES